MLESLLRHIPPAHQGAFLGLLSNIPDYAPRIAVAGSGSGALGYLLKKRPGVTVFGVVDDPHQAALALQLLDGVADSSGAGVDWPAEGIDALLLCNLEEQLAAGLPCLSALAPRLGANGLVYALLSGSDAAALATLEGEVARGLASRGFGIYSRWPMESPEAFGALVAAVSSTYNPIAHAADLRASGLPHGAFHVLEGIPAVYLTGDADVRALVGVEKLRTLACWIDVARGHDVSSLLVRALDEFYQLSDARPEDPAAYVAMADCWEKAGDGELARRLLRSIQHLAPNPELARRADALVATPSAGPDWSAPGGPWPKRLLYVIHPRPHYGLDVLYDGLCDCLGEGGVVEYPWKPTLHGGDTPDHKHYPCRFNRPGGPVSLEGILQGLHEGAYDAILFADIEGDLPEHDVVAILGARGDCPVFLVDGLDEFVNLRPRVLARMGLGDCAGYFKREMHRAVDYGPDCWPMPFAYTGAQGLAEPVGERAHAFFWAGHRRFGLRRLYLDAIEKAYGWNLNQTFDQAAYLSRMRQSRIGLNCFGMGFDTVRYWELAAQGCLVLSERLPIHIPHNFEDGRHAVFFSDLPELLARLAYYLAHPEACRAIGEAGRLHFQRYHTNRARAGQVLDRIGAVLGENYLQRRGRNLL